MAKQTARLSPFAWGLLSISFVMSISQSAMTTAYPILMARFHVNTDTVQWITTGFMVAMVLVMPLSPWLLDNLKLRTLLNWIVGIFILGTLVAMLAPSFSFVIGGRLLEGIAVGALFPTFQSIIMENTASNIRGAAMGIVGLVMGSALAIGPIVSGIILKFGSWRAIFGLFLIVLLIIIIYLQHLIQNTHQLKKSHFDFLSVFLLLGFGGLLDAINLIPTMKLNWQWFSYFGISLILLGLFVARQFKVSHPFLDLSVFKYHGFSPAMLLTGASYSGLILATVLLPLYYQKIFHLNPFWSGIWMVPAAFILSRLNPLAGKMLDHFGLRRLVIIGMFLITGGFIVLGVGGIHSMIFAVIGGILLESGNAFIMMPSVTAANNVLPKQLITHGTAVITSMRQLIGATSVVIASLLITNYYHHGVSYPLALSHTALWLLIIPLIGILLTPLIITKRK